jgi:hypothetical protein
VTFQFYFCQGRLVGSGDNIRVISVLCVLGGRKKKKKKNVWSVFRSEFIFENMVIWCITTQIPCSTFSWNRIIWCWETAGILSTKFSVTCLCDFDCTIVVDTLQFLGLLVGILPSTDRTVRGSIVCDGCPTQSTNEGCGRCWGAWLTDIVTYEFVELSYNLFSGYIHNVTMCQN